MKISRYSHVTSHWSNYKGFYCSHRPGGTRRAPTDIQSRTRGRALGCACVVWLDTFSHESELYQSAIDRALSFWRFEHPGAALAGAAVTAACQRSEVRYEVRIPCGLTTSTRVHVHSFNHHASDSLVFLYFLFLLSDDKRRIQVGLDFNFINCSCLR